ncbi:hypothetical protein AO367_1083 [Moraxella catarrhalis]|nr:hypothetical protein AO380_1680 [Moraxella catarrhalis]OAV30489.1 hypothetical protein AO367_1083 [Moraxella catarrhalis]
MPEFWARSKRIFRINQPIRPKSHKRCHFKVVITKKAQ